MFANLKNKLIEEVKASPSKFQQFANAAQAAVSSSASTTSGSDSTTPTTTNENFFSITEEDTPQNSPFKPFKQLPGHRSSAASHGLNNGSSTGTIPRTRKLSNSSMASDISFRLPSYDSPAVYHLESDMDASGSEMGDSVSSVKLNTISKEQLYEAYKNSLDRYHKYRHRYTDLAKRYKELERDSEKARSVLVETQEKAIRRISELREQCTLEQQAKAHLEEALRMEMEDMNCKMLSYQKTLKILGKTPDNLTDSLIDLDESETLANGNSASMTNLSIDGLLEKDAASKIEELEKRLQERDQQLKELTIKLEASTATIETLTKQEEENALLLAQTKQAIHSELEAKEAEVNKLKDSVKQLQSDLQTASKKEGQSSGVSTDLKGLKEKLKSAVAAKQEVDAKLIAAEHMLAKLKEETAGKEKKLQALEERNVSLVKDNESKLDELRRENERLNQAVQNLQRDDGALANSVNELEGIKSENRNLQRQVEDNQKLLMEAQEELLSKSTMADLLKAQLGTFEEQLVAEKRTADHHWMQFQNEKLNSNKLEEQLELLKAELDALKEQTAGQDEHKAVCAQLNAVKEELSNKEKELKTTTNKITKQKKQHEVQQNKMRDQTAEIERLTNELLQQEELIRVTKDEAKRREEQILSEKDELTTQVTTILQDITQLEEQLRVIQQSHGELEAEKRNLELKLENLQQQTQDVGKDSQHWQTQLVEAEEKIKHLEAKLQNVESENSQLAEKSCLLEESSARLEKLLADHERRQGDEAANVSELFMKLEVAEDTIQKLNEKMSQILDENSRMHNTQELMDHDHRTLQDKCDVLEKEKLVALDTQKCLESEVQKLTAENNALKSQLHTITVELEKIKEHVRTEKEQHDVLIKQNADFKKLKIDLEDRTQSLMLELDELRAAQSDDAKLQQLLEERHAKIQSLQQKLQQTESEYGEKLRQQSVEYGELEEKLSQMEEANTELERAKEQLSLLQDQKQSLDEELVALRRELEQQTELNNSLRSADKDASTEKDELTELIRKLEGDVKNSEQLMQLKSTEVDEARNQLNLITDQFQTSERELKNLKDINAKLSAENQKLQTETEEQKVSSIQALAELEQKLQTVSEENDKLKQSQASGNINPELNLENEYLNKHTKQLEEELAKEKEAGAAKQQQVDELKEKLKSLQCELYVLQDTVSKNDENLIGKQTKIDKIQAELETLKKTHEETLTELTRQTEHSNYVIEQNDTLQRDQLHAQQQLAESEQKLTTVTDELDQLKEWKAREADKMLKEIAQNNEIISALRNDIDQLTKDVQSKEQLQEDFLALRIAMEEQRNAESATIQQETNAHKRTASSSSASAVAAAINSDNENLRRINETLQRELEELKHTSKAEITNLQQEIEDLQNSSRHLIERLNGMTQTGAGELNDTDVGELYKEKDELEMKLKTIMNEVQDVSNRNIFLEQKCENYLILEQSNERLKLQNAKLSRQLDETLVSMQHNENITGNTEFEYLKNIMFQYLTGSANGNNETLVKVISAVLKFSPQQTQVALEKEHQRRSLINKIL